MNESEYKTDVAHCSPVPLSALDVEMWIMSASQNLPLGVRTKDGKNWKAEIMFIPENVQEHTTPTAPKP